MKITKRHLDSRFEIDDADDEELMQCLESITYWAGYFIIEFNELDRWLTKAISEHIDGELDTNEYAYLFISGMSFTQKVDLLERYYEYFIPKVWSADESTESMERRILLRMTLKQLVSGLREMANTRNLIAHADYYSLDVNGNVVGRVKFEKGNAEQHLVSITKAFLAESAKKAGELKTFLNGFEMDANV